MGSKYAFETVGRTDAYLLHPKEVNFIKDKKDILYDARLEESLDEQFVASVADGILQGVGFWNDGGKLYCIYGLQRCKAAIQIWKDTGKVVGIPHTVRKGTALQMLEWKVAENEQRLKTDPIWRASNAQKMLDEGSSMDRIKDVFQMSASSMTLHLSLLSLDPRLQKLVASRENDKLSYTFASRHLSKLPVSRTASTDIGVRTQWEVYEEMKANGTLKGVAAEQAVHNEIATGDKGKSGKKGAPRQPTQVSKRVSWQLVDRFRGACGGEAKSEHMRVADATVSFLQGADPAVAYADFPELAAAAMAAKKRPVKAREIVSADGDK